MMKDKISFPPDIRAWHPSPLLGQIVLITTLNEDRQFNISPKIWVSVMAFQPPLVEECKAHLECVLVQPLAFGTEVILTDESVASS